MRNEMRGKSTEGKMYERGWDGVKGTGKWTEEIKLFNNFSLFHSIIIFCPTEELTMFFFVKTLFLGS